jgi:hypothetical protein
MDEPVCNVFAPDRSDAEKMYFFYKFFALPSHPSGA